MWMMGYNDGGEFSVPDSFSGRKLRPLIPRPATAASTSNTATMNSPCLGRLHGTDLLALNHHLVTMAEQSKKEFNTQQVVVSSRWNPTPEQLQTLEELYQRGTRTPSADQIQHITAQLRRYGKIEGKNVFYWFQNHKARERQKRRRQFESASDEQYRDIECLERKESGANKTVFEVEQTKDWAHPTNCSTLAERTVSIQRAAKASVAECRTDGRVLFDERELLQHRRSMVERNATWQMMQLSCSPPTHLINSTATATTAPAAIVRTMDPKLRKSQDLNIYVAPYRDDFNYLVSVGDDDLDIHEHGNETCCGESQTLQLFPLRSGDGNENGDEKENEISVGEAVMNANFAPYQFFEFLPLKN